MSKCSLCSKTEIEVDKLISDGTFSICSECIIMAHDMITDTPKDKIRPVGQLTPKTLVTMLNDYVIGQDAAKKTLSIAIYNHYKRINNTNKLKSTVVIDKSNVLLVGQTGTGKTHLARTLAKFLDIPFTVVDASTITPQGYIGGNSEDWIQALIAAADGDIDKAKNGCVFVDEIDKLAKRRTGVNLDNRDLSEGAQQSLLKMIEGHLMDIPVVGSRKQGSQTQQFNTKDVLFIFAGSFPGIEKIIADKSTKNNNTMGFGATFEKKDEEEKALEVTHQDFVNFGFIPEFVGRIPVICSLTPLTKEILRSILLEPKDAIFKQYHALFDMDDIELEIVDEAITKIVDDAHTHKTGARGLRTSLENLLLDAQYEAPDMDGLRKIIINADLKIEYVCDEQELVAVTG